MDIVNPEFLLCNVFYSIVNIYWLTLEDCFYCYSQKILSAVAKESLISYDLHRKHQKDISFNTVTPNATLNKAKQM